MSSLSGAALPRGLLPADFSPLVAFFCCYFVSPVHVFASFSALRCGADPTQRPATTLLSQAASALFQKRLNAGRMYCSEQKKKPICPGAGDHLSAGQGVCSCENTKENVIHPSIHPSRYLARERGIAPARRDVDPLLQFRSRALRPSVDRAISVSAATGNKTTCSARRWSSGIVVVRVQRPSRAPDSNFPARHSRILNGLPVD